MPLDEERWQDPGAKKKKTSSEVRSCIPIKVKEKWKHVMKQSVDPLWEDRREGNAQRVSGDWHRAIVRPTQEEKKRDTLENEFEPTENQSLCYIALSNVEKKKGFFLLVRRPFRNMCTFRCSVVLEEHKNKAALCDERSNDRRLPFDEL